MRTCVGDLPTWLLMMLMHGAVCHYTPLGMLDRKACDPCFPPPAVLGAVLNQMSVLKTLTAQNMWMAVCSNQDALKLAQACQSGW